MLKEMKIIKYIAVLSAMLALSSCEDLLDRFPKDKLFPETFLSNEKEMRAYTNALYTMLPTGFYSGGQSDLLVGRELNDEMRGARTINSGDSGWSWGQLRTINTFLEYSDNCKDVRLREEYTGLVLFFRAFFYFEKVKKFGDVPWYDHTLSSDDEELFKPRDSRELVMQNILADLDYAIANLPEAHSDYRITKWTALALKSRVCLFEGTYRKYHANDVTLQTLPADAKPYTWYLQQAADASMKFISTSKYGIYNTEGTNKSYIGLFTKHDVSEGTNKEVILARDYSRTYGVTHTANGEYISTTLNKYGFTRKMIASYLMADGTRFTDKPGWETMQFVEETAGRDPRLSQSIRTPGYCRPGTDVLLAPNLNHSITGYAPIKYFMSPEDDGTSQSYCDFILFRAAEVYLNYAEAKAELGEITQADINISIKPLRDRVGMPNLVMEGLTVDPYLLDVNYGGFRNPVLLNNPQEAVILEIRRERAIELLGEGFRYYDIIRWAEGHSFECPLQGMYFPGEGSYDLNGDGADDITLYVGDKAPATHADQLFKLDAGIVLSKGTSGYVDNHKTSRPGWTWDDTKDYLYPIPVKERSLTEGKLTQNPGWPNVGVED